MTARHAVPLWRLLVLRIRLKLGLWRLLAERALCRGIRRAVDWMVPAG